MNRKRIMIINISVSVVIAILLFSNSNLHFALVGLLNLTGKYFSSISTNPLDVLIIAGIPVWTYPLYRKNQSLTIKKIILVNSIAVLILFCTCITAFILLSLFSKPVSPFFPYDVIIMPFPFFPTIVLLAGMLLTYLIFILSAGKTKSLQT